MHEKTKVVPYGSCSRGHFHTNFYSISVDVAMAFNYRLQYREARSPNNCIPVSIDISTAIPTDSIRLCFYVCPLRSSSFVIISSSTLETTETARNRRIVLKFFFSFFFLFFSFFCVIW